MKTLVIPIILSLSVASSFGANSQVVGFATSVVSGGAGAFSAVSNQFQKDASFVGSPTGVSGSVLSFAQTNVGDGTFSATDPNGAPAFYLRVTSGSNQGLVFDVTDNTGTSITLDAVDVGNDLATVISTEDSVEVIAYNTIADIFGAANEVGLTSGASFGDSDIVYVMSSDGVGSYSQYYYQTDSTGFFGGTGWRQVGEISDDASGVRVSPDSGIFIRRISSGNLNVVNIGTVAEGAFVTPIVPGFNLITSPFPVDVTLDESNLYDATGQSGVVSGGDFQSSDVVFIINPDGTFQQYYRQTDDTGFFGGSGWRAVGNLSDDVGAIVELKSGSAFILKHVGSGTTWNNNLEI